MHRDKSRDCFFHFKNQIKSSFQLYFCCVLLQYGLLGLAAYAPPSHPFLCRSKTPLPFRLSKVTITPCLLHPGEPAPGKHPDSLSPQHQTAAGDPPSSREWKPPHLVQFHCSVGDAVMAASSTTAQITAFLLSAGAPNLPKITQNYRKACHCKSNQILNLPRMNGNVTHEL